jgi:DNA primase
MSVDNILDQVNIIDEISEVVKLTRSGRNYKGLCPFHSENSPSFVVSPQKKLFKCFGCGKSGNVISFVMEFYNNSFPEALYFLSKKYDIPIDKKSFDNFSALDRYFLIMKKASAYYQSQLYENVGSYALDYLGKRGFIKDEMLKFRLGYAPTGQKNLIEYLRQDNITLDEMLKLGLVVKTKNDSYIDFFRNRVMFPILNAQGKTIAFGGRAIDNTEDIKYLNSPTTILFDKSKSFYGLNTKSIQSVDYVVIVEGYMDCLALKKIGIKNCVATLGAQLSNKHVEILSKMTNNVILAFDMDKAGVKATIDSAMMLKRCNFNIKRLILDGAKDPDEFINKYGKDSFISAISTSSDIFDILLFTFSQDLDLEQFEGKKMLINRLIEYFHQIKQPIEYEELITKLSDYMNVDRELLKLEIPFNTSYVQKEELKLKNELATLESEIERIQISIKNCSILKEKVELRKTLLELVKAKNIILDKIK